MNTELPPILISDFDGTAVQLASGGIQNMRKFPLESIPNYKPFVEGVAAQGVEVGPIVSRRPADIFGQRLGVTQKTIERIGIADFFGPDNVFLEGSVAKFWQSETRKAQKIASYAGERVVGMIDDKPHRIGIELVRVFATKNTAELHPVVLGVVNHEKSEEYLERLLATAIKNSFDVSEVDSVFNISQDNRGLDVVMLGPYSYFAGESFADFLHDTE